MKLSKKYFGYLWNNWFSVQSVTVDCSLCFFCKMNSLQASVLKDFKQVFPHVLNTEYSLVAVFLVLLVFEKWIRKFVNNYRFRDEEYRGQTIFEFDTLPGPSRLPIIGSLHHLKNLRSTINMFRDYGKRFGPVVRCDLLSEKFVILNNAPMIQTMLQSTDIGHYVKSPLLYDLAFKNILGNGLITAHGEHWKSQRKLLSPTFSYKSFQSYFRLFMKYASELVSDLDVLFENDGDVDMKSRQIGSLVHLTSMKIMTEAVMGLDMYKDNADGLAFYSAASSTKQIVAKRLHNPLLMVDFFWKLHPLSKEYDNAVDTIISIGKKMIKKHKLAKKEAEGSSAGIDTEERNDNFSKGRNMVEEMLKSKMSDTDILYEINTMIFAGFESTSEAIHFLLFMLALNPDKQSLCREEIDAILDDPMKCPDGELTYDATMDLKYVERCFNETLRMLPPVFAFFRKLETPLRLTDTLVIPEGINVTIPPLSVQMNPEYFPNPEKFDPDRFLRKGHQYAYIPFSGGPRVCIGSKFAIMEAKVVAAQILRHFEVHTTDEMKDVNLLPNIILTPERNYDFIFKRRKNIPIRKNTLL